MKKIVINSEYDVQKVVENKDTAIFMGSGTEEVFATPAMVALMENSAMKCLEPFLDSNETSVGTLINISHISATPCSMKVHAVSRIVAAEGRKVDFAIEAFDEAGKIGEGTHSRFIVEKEKFVSKTKSKLNV